MNLKILFKIFIPPSAICAIVYVFTTYFAGYYYLQIKQTHSPIDIFILLICVPLLLIFTLAFIIYSNRVLITSEKNYKYWPSLLILFCITSILIVIFDFFLHHFIDNSLSKSFSKLLTNISSTEGKEIDTGSVEILSSWPYILQNFVLHTISILIGLMIGTYFTLRWKKNTPQKNTII